jgi:hypothetical protein
MKLFFIFCFIPFLAFAQVSQVEIMNFNFNYTDPNGEGEAEVFNYQLKDREAGSQKVQVTKREDGFYFSLSGIETREFIVKDLPAVAQNASDINLAGFNLAYKENATLNFTQASFRSPEDDLNLKNFSLDCSRNNSTTHLMHSLIIGCVERMNLKVGSFNSNKKSFTLDEAQERLESIIRAVDERNETRGGVSLKNLELKVVAGKFNLAGDIKAQISGRAVGKGTIQFNPADSVLTAKVSEIKFGIWDVTSQVFDELKKQQTATFKVKQPYIYITIK